MQWIKFVVLHDNLDSLKNNLEGMSSLLTLTKVWLAFSLSFYKHGYCSAREALVILLKTIFLYLELHVTRLQCIMEHSASKKL